MLKWGIYEYNIVLILIPGEHDLIYLLILSAIRKFVFAACQILFSEHALHYTRANR